MKALKITIDGVEQTIDADAILTIRNPEAERAVCAVELAYWGAIWGAKLEESEIADAAYRQWHGQTIFDLLSSEEKAPAEWKVKAVVEKEVNFMKHKQRIAKAAREVQTAKGIFEAYSRKADILARLIARETTEMVRSGDMGRLDRDGAAPVVPERKPEDLAARNARVAAAVAARKAAAPK